MTAAQASSHPVFRELFPDEILSAGQLAAVTNVTFLATSIAQADPLDSGGDASAFRLLYEHFRSLEEIVHQQEGTVVKTWEDGLLAVFYHAEQAIRAGLNALAQESPSDPEIRLGVHRGPAMAVTMNDRLDYFGATVKQSLQTPQFAEPGELVLSQPVASDPNVAALLQERAYEGHILPNRFLDRSEIMMQRWVKREMV